MNEIQDLINLLKSTNYLEKENAAKELASKGKDAKDALPELRKLLIDQTDPITIGEFLNAIVKIESNTSQLINEFESYLTNTKFSLKAAEIVQGNIELSTHLRPKIWDEFRRIPSYDLGKTLVRIEYSVDKSLKGLQDYIDQYYEAETTAVLLMIGIWAAGDITQGNIPKERDTLLQKIWKSLETSDDLTVINYSYWVIEKIKARPAAAAELKSRSISLWKILYINYLYPGLNLNLELTDKDIEQIMANALLDDTSKAYILIENFRLRFDSYWQTNKDKVLDYIITNLRKGLAQLTRTLITWLTINVYSVPVKRIDGLIVELDKGPAGEYEEERKARLEVLKILQQRKTEHLSLSEIRDWKLKDIDNIVHTIVKIVEGGTKRGYSSLFDTWVEWMADERKELVETTMEEMSNKGALFNSIPYLVTLLDKDFSRDQKICELIMEKVIPKKIVAYYKEQRSYDQEVENELHDWNTKLKSEYGDSYDLIETEELRKKKKLNELVNWVVQEDARIRETKVKREISRKLAEMSDENLIESENSKQKDDLQLIKKELKKYAVPVISKKLNSEKDTEVRENYARVLGNIGGREAVDAIARAIGGDERNRAARQDLLSKYYLEPSKARSEEAAKILNDAVEEAKRTLRLLQITNTITFTVGIILLVGGVVIAVIYPDKWTKLAGALASLGGLAGVILHLLNTPLDRIQTAMANLVQIETAFTSFIWELNLNGTYIQSQYVAEGILQDSDIAKTVDRIEGAMSLAMNLVSVYTHNGEGAKGHISSITPALTKGGSEVRIRGDHLKGIYSDKKENGIVAIDHEPINATIKEWGDREVSFVIPEKLDEAEEPKTYKVSLFIDGVETNSVPLKVVPQHNGHAG